MDIDHAADHTASTLKLKFNYLLNHEKTPWQRSGGFNELIVIISKVIKNSL